MWKNILSWFLPLFETVALPALKEKAQETENPFDDMACNIVSDLIPELSDGKLTKEERLSVIGDVLNHSIVALEIHAEETDTRFDNAAVATLKTAIEQFMPLIVGESE